jgi:hypothetical protein
VSETLQIWLFAGSFALIGGSYAWQWAHRKECEKKRIDNAVELSNLKAEVTRLFEEVGRVHNQGMRHRLHRAENRIRMFAQKLGMEIGNED